jgi:hypothetical protein
VRIHVIEDATHTVLGGMAVVGSSRAVRNLDHATDSDDTDYGLNFGRQPAPLKITVNSY